MIMVMKLLIIERSYYPGPGVDKYDLMILVMKLMILVLIVL